MSHGIYLDEVPERKHLLATNEILAHLSITFNEDLRQEMARIIAHYDKGDKKE